MLKRSYCLLHPLPCDGTHNELQVVPGLPEMLLWKSATLVGFFLLHYAPLYKKHLQKLVASWQLGKLHVSMDGRHFRSDLPQSSKRLTGLCMAAQLRTRRVVKVCLSQRQRLGNVMLIDDVQL